MEFALWSLVIDLLPIFDGFEFIKRSSSSYSKLFIKDCPKCREKTFFMPFDSVPWINRLKYYVT